MSEQPEVKASAKYRLRSQLLEKQGGKCAWCEQTLDLHTDPASSGNYPNFTYIVPLSQGGSRDKENVVLACWACNQNPNRKPDGLSPSDRECNLCGIVFDFREDNPKLNLCPECCPKFEYDGYGCPNCGWQCDSITHDEDAPVTYGPRHENFSDGSSSWTEHWTCPDCETEFDQDNGT